LTEIIDGVPGQIDAPGVGSAIVGAGSRGGHRPGGPGWALTGLTKTVLETALENEMGEHLRYDKHDPAGLMAKLAQRTARC
jgi:hypothetical protein